MGFLNDQVSYGPPAEYFPRNQELEGKYQAYQDFKPEAAKSALSTGITNIAGRDVRHITRTDKRYVDQLKGYVDGKTGDFQSRIDKGENTASIFKEADQLKNQYEQATQELNKRADIQEAFDTELKKSGLSPQEQDVLKEIQYNNIEAFTKENGFTANGMPTFPIAKAVNYNEIARKAINDVAEHVKEDNPSYAAWKQLSVDPAKYQQVLKTMKSKDRDDFYSAFSQQLANDPEAQKYLTQTANSQLFIAHQTGTDFRQEGADMNIGEMPDEKFANAQQFIDNNKEELKQQLIQSKIHSVSSKLAGVAAYDNTTYTDKIIDNTEAKLRKAKQIEEESETNPINLPGTNTPVAVPKSFIYDTKSKTYTYKPETTSNFFKDALVFALSPSLGAIVSANPNLGKQLIQASEKQAKQPKEKGVSGELNEFSTKTTQTIGHLIDWFSPTEVKDTKTDSAVEFIKQGFTERNPQINLDVMSKQEQMQTIAQDLTNFNQASFQQIADLEINPTNVEKNNKVYGYDWFNKNPTIESIGKIAGGADQALIDYSDPTQKVQKLQDIISENGITKINYGGTIKSDNNIFSPGASFIRTLDAEGNDKLYIRKGTLKEENNSYPEWVATKWKNTYANKEIVPLYYEDYRKTITPVAADPSLDNKLTMYKDIPHIEYETSNGILTATIKYTDKSGKPVNVTITNDDNLKTKDQVQTIIQNLNPIIK